MKPLPHIYRVNLAEETGSYALLSDAGLPELRTAPPADFDEPGDAWSPEHLLLAAVESCFLFTFHAVAQASQLSFKALKLSGEGIVNRLEGAARLSAIVLRATLRIASAKDRDRAMRILEKKRRSLLGFGLAVNSRPPRAGSRHWLS
jgi:organic hydroperoxide reductase OsmC/OhrA